MGYSEQELLLYGVHPGVAVRLEHVFRTGKVQVACAKKTSAVNEAWVS